MAVCAALAGGASLRFPGGKLGWQGLDGKPLLLRVLEALEESGACSKIIAVATQLTLEEVNRILQGTYDIAQDPPWLPCQGPLRGMAAAALETGGAELQIAAGDMAWLNSQAIASLVEAARRHEAATAVPMWASGYVQTLAGYIREPWLVVEACLRRGPWGRPSDVYRGARKPLLVGSRLLGDTDGKTFISVNTIQEATSPQPDPPGEAMIDAVDASRLYREAVRYDSCSPSRSLILYRDEALAYRRLGVNHFARHAWQDYCDALHMLGHSEVDTRSQLPWRCTGRRVKKGLIA